MLKLDWGSGLSKVVAGLEGLQNTIVTSGLSAATEPTCMKSAFELAGLSKNDEATYIDK